MPEHKLDEAITVDTLVTNNVSAWREKLLFGGKCGDMVMVRPCAPEYEDKTFLGVLLGEIALGVSMGVRKTDNALVYDMAYHNPAIFVPDLNTVIFGAGSWWGKIKSEDQLRQISDDDINNVWYVRALQQLTADKEKETADGE